MGGARCDLDALILLMSALIRERFFPIEERVGGQIFVSWKLVSKDLTGFIKDMASEHELSDGFLIAPTTAHRRSSLSETV